MTPLFSVVLIARNEEKTLPRLLESLSEFMEKGGEVVLVDTGSSDTTAQIARDAGCKVEEVGNRFLRTISESDAKSINGFVIDGEGEIVKAGDTLFDYASARNYAATLASNDMVATPDCDEMYTTLNLDVINKIIAGGAEQLEYNFVFAHDEHGGELIKFLHSKFYNRTKLTWVGTIHEVLSGDANRVKLAEDIIKLEHWQNPETNRGGYLKGLALSVLEEPNNDRHVHYFGRELLYAGKPRSAIAMLERHVAMNKWPEERSQSQLHIGDAQMVLGNVKEAIHAWIDSFDTAPNRREGLMRIAEYYYKHKSHEHVIAYTLAALTIPNSAFYAAFLPYYEQLPHELLYWAYWQIGEMDAARAHFNMCIDMKPHHTQYLHDYRFFHDLPRISIIIPTLRAGGLDRVLASIQTLNYPAEKIETIVLHDEPRIGVPKRVNEGARKATGEWIVYAADDMEFDPNCIIEAVMLGKNDPDHAVSLVAFNGGPVTPDKGNICEHFMIWANYVNDTLGGHIFDEDFHHVGVDNLLWAIMEKAGEAARAEYAVVHHHHFSKTGEMDAVNKIAWDPEKVSADRDLLKKKLASL